MCSSPSTQLIFAGTIISFILSFGIVQAETLTLRCSDAPRDLFEIDLDKEWVQFPDIQDWEAQGVTINKDKIAFYVEFKGKSDKFRWLVEFEINRRTGTLHRRDFIDDYGKWEYVATDVKQCKVDQPINNKF